LLCELDHRGLDVDAGVADDQRVRAGRGAVDSEAAGAVRHGPALRRAEEDDGVDDRIPRHGGLHLADEDGGRIRSSLAPKLSGQVRYDGHRAGEHGRTNEQVPRDQSAGSSHVTETLIEIGI
jgi:hypothetical protein